MQVYLRVNSRLSTYQYASSHNIVNRGDRERGVTTSPTMALFYLALLCIAASASADITFTRTVCP